MQLRIKPYVVINKVRPHMVRTKEMLDVNDIMSTLMAELIGIIPDDEGVIASTNRLEPSVHSRPSSTAAQAYKNIARRIMGEQVPFVQIQRDSLFSRLRKALIS